MYVPYFVGITGGSGSGKTHFVNQLLKRFNSEDICLITQDNYYIDLHLQPKDVNGIENFDLPESIDANRLYQDLIEIKNGNTIRLAEYTFNNPKSTSNELVFKPAPIIIVEGILVFYFEKIRKLFDLSILIDAKDLIKVKRRILRDAKERGYDLDDVLYRYENHVSPFFERHIRPLKEEVDIVIPNNNGFDRALEVIEIYLKNKLRDNQ